MGTTPLQAERRQGLPRLLCQVWAGLECGVLAGLTILVWFALHSLVRGEFWWSKFNVAAGWFYDTAVYHAGLGTVTLSGASVLVVFYCLAGALFALGWDALFRGRTFLAVPLYVIGVHFVAAYFFWPSFGPFARLWFPWTAIAPAHFVLFVVLMRYKTLYTRLLNDFGDPRRLPREPLAPHPDLVEGPPPAVSFEAPGSASAPTEPSED